MLSEKGKQKAQYVMLSVAMLLIVITAILPLLNIYWAPAKWIYAFGAELALAERLTERYKGSNIRLRRLYRMAKFSALLYCVSAYFLFFGTGEHPTEWLAFLMAGAVVQTYCIFVHDHEVKKENKQK